MNQHYYNPFEEGFKKIQYNRYADDFVIGVIGSKKDAEKIKEDVKIFLQEKLHLEMSEEKTKVTHSSKPVRYLGYDFKVIHSKNMKRCKNGDMKRVWYGKVFLYMPKEKWIKKAMERGAIQVKRNNDTGKEMWRPMPRKDLMNRSDAEIVSTFNSEIRGLYNFYRIAENVGALHKYYYMVRYSMPILEDLYDLLRAQDEKEAQYIATALEIYVTGSLNVFNHRSNVDINNRIVCYDIKELGKQLKKIGMLVVQDQVWNRVTINRAARKSTRYYIDEMHLLLKEEQTAAYTVEIWKRFRKWGGIPTGITQNVKDLLSSREVENIFENSDFVYMLNQAGGDRQILARQLGISPHQLSYVTHSGEGEGLLFYGSTILPFVDHFHDGAEHGDLLQGYLPFK